MRRDILALGKRLAQEQVVILSRGGRENGLLGI